MPASPNLGHAFGLEPKEAVAYFERLGYKVTDDWQATAEAVRGKAFAVAKSGSLDIVKDIKAGLIHAAKTGESEADFIKRMGAELQAKGWAPNSPGRLKTIFRTNMQSAYMAGRWEQFQASRKTRPYLQYVAVMDASTRPSHAAMNGLVFHIDDPIWQTHYPPCGYNCRCRVRSHSAASLKAQKLTVRDSSADIVRQTIDPKTGELVHLDPPGYATPARPVRVAQRDSAPGEYPVVKAGQELHWEPEHDPKFVDGEGPPWKTESRRVVMQPDKGFGFNQGRWDEYDVPPGVPQEAPRRARVLSNQPDWQDAGRPDLRNVAQREPAPPLMPAADSASAARQSLAEVLGVSEERPLRTVQTPVEAVIIDYEKLAHLVEKRADARERFGLYLLSTLAKPFEVYLTEYDDGTFRSRYIGLFEGRQQLLVVALVNRDGTVLWNIMQSDTKRLNEQRVGTLLYVRPVDEE